MNLVMDCFKTVGVCLVKFSVVTEQTPGVVILQHLVGRVADIVSIELKFAFWAFIRYLSVT